ncbi:MAG: hypothetical protein LBF38_04120, partial [Deltaproteobacteria bacterium]|nr:hypothetical protein [Deltaproteobacteria bacterium]
IYFDPPYFTQSHRLYKNALTLERHIRLSEMVLKGLSRPRVLTYDNAALIGEPYKTKEVRTFNLNCSVSNNRKGTEIMTISDSNLFPTDHELEKLNFRFNAR